MAGGGNWVTFKIPSNPTILSFCNQNSLKDFSRPQDYQIMIRYAGPESPNYFLRPTCSSSSSLYGNPASGLRQADTNRVTAPTPLLPKTTCKHHITAAEAISKVTYYTCGNMHSETSSKFQIYLFFKLKTSFFLNMKTLQINSASQYVLPNFRELSASLHDEVLAAGAADPSSHTQSSPRALTAPAIQLSQRLKYLSS